MTVEIDGANNIVKTNTISEVTSANGVTVDGLNIKDSKLVTANSVIQTNITDQAINEAKMQISNAPTNGYALTAQSGNTGGLTWASVGGDNTPRFSVSKSQAQTITNNTLTKITFNTEYLDTNNAFASDKFTCPSGEGGQYFMTMKLLFWKNSANFLKNVEIAPYLNGGAISLGNGNGEANTSFIMGASVAEMTQMNMITSFIVTLSENNYVECYAKALTVNSGDPAIYSYYTNWSGFKLI